ncbi:MAG: 30S ribosomal protein S13 [archaeon]
MEKQDKQERQDSNKQERQNKMQKEEKIYAAGIVRIMATDIPATSAIYCGLTKIKGISWSISNAMCHLLKLDGKKKMNSLTESEIEKITEFLKKPSLPVFIMNRRRDVESGVDKHLIKTDLDLQKEFDIRNMKKIRSYKGWRHASGQPVRGQRTKSHFRTSGKSLGVHKTKSKPAASPAAKATAKAGKK